VLDEAITGEDVNSSETSDKVVSLSLTLLAVVDSGSLDGETDGVVMLETFGKSEATLVISVTKSVTKETTVVKIVGGEGELEI